MAWLKTRDIKDGVVTNVKLGDKLLHAKKFSYSFAVAGGGTGAYTLTDDAGNAQTLPESAVIISATSEVVIGVTSGIGLEGAQQLNFSGARTFIASRKEPRALSSGKFIKCDVREESQVQYLVDEVIRQAGTIDILINSMAINQCRPIEEIDLSDWQDVITTNITGVFNLSK